MLANVAIGFACFPSCIVNATQCDRSARVFVWACFPSCDLDVDPIVARDVVPKRRLKATTRLPDLRYM